MQDSVRAAIVLRALDLSFPALLARLDGLTLRLSPTHHQATSCPVAGWVKGRAPGSSGKRFTSPANGGTGEANP
uniref:Uncharacterized protein n=1 Tax=Pseudomonas putida TaxID=303 RepID=Q9K4T2_PSEPU|nr:hypothetical protein [Pseudomonas putida]